jgi:glyoxylate reductase
LNRPIVAVSRSTLPGSALDRLRGSAVVEVWPYKRPPNPDELASLAGDAQALLCVSSDRIDESLLEQCPKLKCVATVSAGFDHLDLAALTARGILATNAPDVLTESTADLTWALILGVRRQVVAGDRLVRSGGWTTPDGFDLLPAYDIHGATLGIIGYGKVGRAVARRAKGFGMTVLHTSVPPEATDEWSRSASFDELLEAADVVSLHVTLNPATEGLIGEAELRRMKSTAILVNASRGRIVDETALVRALGENWIAGAGLDVVVNEPADKSNPLLDHPHCVVLPHIASATHDTRERMVELAVQQVATSLAGDIPNHTLNRRP